MSISCVHSQRSTPAGRQPFGGSPAAIRGSRLVLSPSPTPVPFPNLEALSAVPQVYVSPNFKSNACDNIRPGGALRGTAIPNSGNVSFSGPKVRVNAIDNYSQGTGASLPDPLNHPPHFDPNCPACSGLGTDAELCDILVEQHLMFLQAQALKLPPNSNSPGDVWLSKDDFREIAKH